MEVRQAALERFLVLIPARLSVECLFRHVPRSNLMLHEPTNVPRPAVDGPPATPVRQALQVAYGSFVPIANVGGG